MITNTELTLYHLTSDANGNDKWIRHNYNKVWMHGGKGASINKGYENANDVDVRIWYQLNQGLDIKDMAQGDIIVRGKLELDITSQQDLEGYEFYNITSITNNTYGNNKHIHLGGK